MRFISISGNAANSTNDVPAPRGPIEILLGCHASIRHFMQLSHTLAGAEGVTHKEITETAAAIFRYFSHALPVHETDESETVFPRLCAALPQGGLVREAAEAMVEQHKAIDELADELLSLCASLDLCPERLPRVARHLGLVTCALDQIFHAHLGLEENVVFPSLCELLSHAQMKEMFREMNQRRQTPLGTIHLVQ